MRLKDLVGTSGILASFDFKTSTRILVPLLCFWNGYNLQVSNCPRFHDSVLDMMSSVENRDFICAPFAHTLYIRDCPNFSFSALRRLVESQLHLPPDFGDPFDPIPTRFRHLYLSGSVPHSRRRIGRGLQQTYQPFSVAGSRTCGRISGRIPLITR